MAKKAYREARQLMQDTDLLIDQLKEELDIARNLLYRYYKEFGGKLTYTVMPIDNCLSPTFDFDKKKETLTVDFVNYDKLGLSSRYQDILGTIKRLS